MANIREHCSWVHHDREAGHGQGDRPDPHGGGQGPPQPCPASRSACRHPPGAGDRRRRGRHPGRAGHRRRRLRGRAGRARAVDRRQDGRAFRDLPHARLLAVHPDAADGRRRPASRTSSCYTYSEVEAVEGFVGNFKVTIRKKARYVDIDKCTGCGAVLERLPVEEEPQRVRLRHGQRARRSTCRFPQAVPARPVIDANACLKLDQGQVRPLREEVPGRGDPLRRPGRAGHRRGRRDRRGHRLQALQHRQGAGRAEALRLRRVRLRPIQGRDRLAAVRAAGLGLRARPAAKSGGPPTAQMPKTVVFISCVGSRDNAKGMSYCSKICCMYTAKHTMLYKHKVHDGAGPRLLHGHPRRRQELRRVRPPGDRAGRGPVPPRPRVEDHRGERQADRPRRRHAGRRAADDRGRPGRAGRGHAPGRRRRGTGPEAQRRLRRVRLPLRIAPQAAAGGDQRGGRVRLRGLPGPEGHSRVGRPGLGRGRQGAGHVQPRAS